MADLRLRWANQEYQGDDESGSARRNAFALGSYHALKELRRVMAENAGGSYEEKDVFDD